MDEITLHVTCYVWTWRDATVVKAERTPHTNWEINVADSGHRRFVADRDVARVGTELARAEVERRTAIRTAEEAFWHRIASCERGPADA